MSIHKPLSWKSVGLVAIGGFFGTLARYGIGNSLEGRTFPLATFIANLSGAFLIGIFFELFASHRSLPGSGKGLHLRPLIVTGFIGSYTTMSAFAVENYLLVHDSHQWAAVSYTCASVILGLAGVRLGMFAVYRLESQTLRSQADLSHAIEEIDIVEDGDA